MIRFTGKKDGRPLIGFGITKAEMARMLQGERIPTNITLGGTELPPIQVIIFGGEDEVAMSLDWQKHMTGDTEIHLPPGLVKS